MEQDGQLSAYRQRLLDALLEHPKRRRQEDPGSLQVLVDQECVGILDCDAGTPTLLSVHRSRPVRTVEIRTAAGLLVGGLCLQEVGVKVARFPVGAHTLELTVHNWPEGGSVKLAYLAAPAWRRRLLAAFARGTPGASRARLPENAWIGGLVMAQAVLAVAVVLLWGDRVRDRAADQAVLSSTTSVMTAPTASTEALARSEQRVAQFAEAQAELLRTLRAQQAELAQVQQTVRAMSGTQRRVGAHVTKIEQRVRDLKEQNADTLQRHVLTELSRAYSERQKIQEQVLALKAEKDALADAMSALEARNLELAQSLQRREGMIAKVLPGPEPVRPGAQPFTFFVSFQDGTSEENIERFLQELHGRRGPITSGWYSVEVTLPGPQTPDGLFESLKKAKIVKAITAKLDLATVK